MNTVFFKNLGIIDFKEAWDLQEKLLGDIILQKKNKTTTNNYLLFCQHPHVYTLGKSGKEHNLLLDSSELKTNNTPFYKINRGGDITYHGPGQLVIYPIFDLDNFFTDIHKYLRYLEDIVISVLGEYGLIGERIDGSTGVWLGAQNNNPRKICAMGVRASRCVTMHGLAFNVNVDLNYFQNIIPCGITNKGVTSLNTELGRSISLKEIENLFCKFFEKKFNILLKNN